MEQEREGRPGSSFQIGEGTRQVDLADLPEGTWFVPQINLLIRAAKGHSITSVTPQDSAEKFTAIYCGGPNTPKSSALQTAANAL